MRVSVVIPALNEEAVIAQAIARAWEAEADEVIVADGGSRDATVALAQAAGAKVVPSPAGRGLQQRLGANAATGDVVLFLHADNSLAAGTIAQIHEALNDELVVGGAFRQHIEAEHWAYRCLEWGNARRFLWWGMAYGDQGIFCRSDVLAEVGGVPAEPLMEDVILARRLRSRGRLALLPGPLHVSARRWRRHGIVRQTLRNWLLVTAWRCGVSPGRLARLYRRHDG